MSELFIIMRNPYIEKLPNLKYLLEYLGNDGVNLNVLTVFNRQYLPPEFKSEHIQLHPINPAKKWLGLRIPAVLRLLGKVLKLGMLKRPKALLGADTLGGLAAFLAAKLLRRPCIQFTLEFPCKKEEVKSLLQWIELFYIRNAELVITFDEFHRDFLIREAGLAKEKCLLLPNSTGPRQPVGDKMDIRSEVGFPEKSILLLHSGGFGPWFSSLELAHAASSWPEEWKLLFHTSHYVEETEYAQTFFKEIKNPNVKLHSCPVPQSRLDAIIQEATIGLAIYSTEHLGYRAELMGLAAGKIGAYLKNGVPVIVQDLPSIRPYIQKYHCGLCVGGISDIDNAVQEILANYNYYRENAFRCYDELWNPVPYCKKIKEKIMSLR
jgi:glycosyltransferase involved in cell wall biosynthesis